MNSLTGKKMGKYDVLEEIGRGGMATVYKAIDTQLKRVVALKVLPEYFRHDPTLLKRFKQEAVHAARLDHPNIIAIYDVGQERGLLYFAMKYVEGRTLKQVIDQEGALSLSQSLGIIRQLASALDYAHELGYVHRDIKPSNILIDKKGQVILTDFGIAKATEGTSLTRTGGTIGTPQYMSPEQCKGLRVDKRSDIYSLGVVLYEMLTGRVPFDADNTPAVLHKQVYEQFTPPTQFNPRIPKLVEKVLSKALAKNPSQRYASAGEMASALAGAARGVPEPATVRQTVPGEPPTVAAPPPNAIPVWAMAGGGAGIILLILVIAFSAWGRGPAPRPEGTRGAVPRTEATTTHTPSRLSTLTPTPPTVRPTPTPTFASTPTFTSTPTPTHTSTPTCHLRTDPQLASVWDQRKVGCPTAHSDVIWAAWEPCERGYLLWRSDTDRVSIFYLQDGTNPLAGNWLEIPEEWKWDGSNPDGVGMSPPPGLYEPKRGFGWLWRTHLGGPDSELGWARGEEKGLCIRIQTFEKGIIFRSDTVLHCEDELYNWATHPSFVPLFFALYGEGTWRWH